MAGLESFGQREDPQEKKEEVKEDRGIDLSVLEDPEYKPLVDDFRSLAFFDVLDLSDEKAESLLRKLMPVMLKLGIPEADIKESFHFKGGSGREHGFRGPLAGFHKFLSTVENGDKLRDNGSISESEYRYAVKSSFRYWMVSDSMDLLEDGYLTNKKVADELIEIGDMTEDEYKKFMDKKGRTPEFLFFTFLSKFIPGKKKNKNLINAARSAGLDVGYDMSGIVEEMVDKRLKEDEEKKKKEEEEKKKKEK